MPPTLIFGDIRSISLPEIVPLLHEHNIHRLDSGAAYDGGNSKRRLGEARIGERFVIDTKIPSGRTTAGTLTADKIDESSKASLQRLQVDKVNVLYVHGPDYDTPLEEQARGFDEVWRKGRFEALGLSNCQSEMVQEWLQISEQKGYIKPTWFQGHYNLFSRTYEEAFFPLLQANGMHFAAYSPFGGGFLLGNLTPERRTGIRFTNHGAKEVYLGYYDQEPMHAAYAKLKAIADRNGLSTGELSLRWLFYHSQLGDGDGIIVGASKPDHLVSACDTIERGPLVEEVATELEILWTAELQKAARSLVD